MADPNTDSALGGLLGIDPEQLRQITAQFGDNPQVAKDALTQSLFTAAAGILGARDGNPWRAIGQGAMQGITAYQPLKESMIRQQGQGLTQGLGALKLANDLKIQNLGMGMLTGGQQPQQQSMAATGAPASVPQGMSQAPQTPPANQGLSNPTAELAFGMMGRKDMADIIHRQYQIEQGPNGTLIRNGQVVGQVIPNAGMMIDGKFQPLPKEATDALVNFSGATATATETAKAGLDLIPVPIGNGQTKMMTRADAAKLFSAQPQQNAVKPPILDPSLTPAQRSLAIQDNAAQFVPRQGNMGGLGITPNPIETAAKTAEQEALGKGYADQSLLIDSEARDAATLKGSIAEFRGLLPLFGPNAAAPVRQRAAELAQSLGANQQTTTAIAGGDLGAMQGFNKQAFQTAFTSARQAVGGVIRNYQEVELMLKANPNISLTPQANKYMLDFMEGVSNYKLARQDARDQWLSPDGMNKSSLAGFQGWFNKTHPAENYLPDANAMKAAFGLKSDGSGPASTNQWGIKRIN